MIREEQIREASIDYQLSTNPRAIGGDAFADMAREMNVNPSFIAGAKWVDKTMIELWNVARNVYEAWMGGTMNDVRECMKDLGHVYDEFMNKGMYETKTE